MLDAFARSLLATAAISLLAPAAWASGVNVRSDFDLPSGAPFPSNRYTVFDGTQNTLRRVKLPKPDCTVQVSDCADIDVINTLDGFSTQPRISVPFTGDIDLTSVNSDNIYLVNLGDTLTLRGYGDRVGINQVMWDPASKSLVFESDQLLQQHSRYLLVITDGVRDSTGKKLKSGGWGEDFGLAYGRDPDGAAYRRELRAGVQSLRPGNKKIVAASLFSTQSISADLAKIRHQIASATPPAVDFNIGLTTGGPVRTLFAAASLIGIQFNRQTGTAPSFTSSFLPTPALNVVPGAVGQIAYGRFTSPDYETAEKLIPATGTLTGVPQPQGANSLVLQLFLPAGPKPPGGWPVAVFGHGFTDSMYGAPWTVASVLASRGIATAAINVVGHGGGGQGTLDVLRQDGLPVTLPAGGRGIDQDSNGVIDSTEGVATFFLGPKSIISNRDGLRQTVVDLMQLVRQIQVGVDADGDGQPDLDKERIYYAGQSFGGIYGTILLGVEGAIKAGVPNVPGGSIAEVGRLGGFRFLTALQLSVRQPQLLNLPPTPGAPFPFNLNFNENMPLRNLPLLVNTVPGATAIQRVLESTEWVTQSANPVAYAPFIRKQPLPRNAAKSIILQFAKGDATVPNPTTTAILRAGDLADRATYFRNDLAYGSNPAVGKNPHVFLTNIGNAAAAPYAVGAQQQIALFFASQGSTVIDPDGNGPFFEVPVTLPLPETLNFIP